jgi:hypothetical protein
MEFCEPSISITTCVCGKSMVGVVEAHSRHCFPSIPTELTATAQFGRFVVVL